MTSSTGLLAGFLAGLLIFLGPPALAVALTPGRRATVVALIGPLILVGAASFFATAALLYRIVPYGVAFLTVTLLASALVCYLTARHFDGHMPVTAPESAMRVLVIVSAFATLGILDCIYIYSVQTWGIDGRAAHVISPMQLDPQRNTNLSTALLRGSDTLFLPGSRILYQLCWYHGSAAILGILPDEATRYYQVAGFTLATGWLLYAVTLWIAFRVCPELLSRPFTLIVLVALVLLDGRLDNTGVDKQLVGALQPGEIAPREFFQYFSLKLLVLTAPQHTLFFIFFLGMLFFRLLDGKARLGRLPLWSAFCTASVLASPVHAAFVLPVYFIAESFLWFQKGWRTVAARASAIFVVAVVALAVYQVLFGYFLHELFEREGAVELQHAWDVDRVPLRSVPFAFLYMGGIGGAVFTVLLVASLAFARRVLITQPVYVIIFTVLAGFTLWNAVVTDVEVRRHWSMASAVLTTIAILAVAPRCLIRIPSGPLAGLGGVLFLTVLLGLDLRLVRKYTEQDYSTIAVDIPWRDYYAASNYLKRERPNANVIAASGEGIVLPISNETVTTLGPKLAVLAHQQLSPAVRAVFDNKENKSVFDITELNDRWLGVMRQIGFDTIVWGPVEESIWGYFGRTILLENAFLLARFGEVGVFIFRRMESHTRLNGTKQQQPARDEFLAHVACTAEIRAALRRQGVRAVFERGEYGISGAHGKAAAKHAAPSPPMNSTSLVAVWSSMGKPDCDLSRLMPAPVWPERAAASLGRGSNLALVATVSQSSIRVSAEEHGAAIGNDGRIEAGLEDGKLRIAHTKREYQPWWQADLGRPKHIDALQIWGRHNSFGERLSNLVVIVSDRPPTARLSAIAERPSARVIYVPGVVQDGDVIPVNTRGRYVRVRLAGAGYFVASEVRIWGR